MKSRGKEKIVRFFVLFLLNLGGVTLPVLRCARGSTSLESFHLHFKRYVIPGKKNMIKHKPWYFIIVLIDLYIFLFEGESANDVHFQAYLLEGLMRWNTDRAAKVVGARSTSYDSRLVATINTLSEEVLGKPLHSKYTGKYSDVLKRESTPF